ncbi:F0F1-type ATP synthase membrane subunit c/vacuolar-type H+-ATPase subunit K [Deinobacterium chartae]|uniref:F0F1-type ATP synthase membrane subunit c/vacuolar-type H+-ATPase subunit K n=1 Tax=Deinobacterium chartae TaxID=521158 RepID=A0A841I662_9DEIO|nr:hypothetical protein [Deinobacterium chartae]MBB6099958.1 F0F1-type ATP synthase membrane subunit c/vacuolar-type H+-ATPase subunit K [Deinobacterium chartae]
MLLLMLLSMFTVNTLMAGINAAVGLTRTVASGVAQVASDPGVQREVRQNDQLQALLTGLDREELNQLIAQNSPELSQEQVAAATATVSNVINHAARSIGRNLSDVSNIGEVVGRRADAVQDALNGQEFVDRLRSRGLSQAEAQEVATVVRQRATEVREQTEQTVREIGRITAETAARAAWIWLLVAGIVLGLAALGGGRGGDVPAGGVTSDRTQSLHKS